jgi:hypothetical protein
MRRVLAAFTVIILATLACSDPPLCPDECTDHPPRRT